MKSNFNNFMEFAQEIDRIEQNKNDFIVPSSKLVMSNDNNLAIIDQESTNSYLINNYAHGQIASRLGIPKQYYDKMETIPGLRMANANAWLNEPDEDRNFMVRTLDKDVRALLSDRYRPLDNAMILQSFLPVVKEHDNLQIMSNSLTEKKLYMQLKFPKLEGEVKEGDIIQAGITLTNSEVGAGAVDVKAMTWRLICTNGMISGSVLRKYHSGRRIGSNEEDYSLFANDTIEAEIQAFQLKLRDILRDALSETKFQNEIIKMKLAADDIIKDVPKTIENVTKRFQLPETTGNAIITNMIKEGNSTHRYGLANGITALAHDLKNRDQQYEMEKLGQKVIDLKSNEWEEIAN